MELKQWNWDVFGNVDLKFKEAHVELNRTQKEMQIIGSNDSRRSREDVTISKLSLALHIQDSFYKEKAGNK